MVGRRGRCAACDAAFAVPAPSPAPKPAEASAANKADTEKEVPQYIGVECRVCGTRLYGRPDQVGKKVKCPDCGALSIVPPPPKPKPKNMPAALEGEQYELWDVDSQPLSSELIAAQPKYVAVKCRKCGTLMYATEKQVGQQIACPDCGTKHVVPSPPKAISKPSVLLHEAEMPGLDPAAHPGERPVVTPLSGKMFHEEEQEAEYARALEKSKRTGKPMEIDSRGRHVMPRYPLLSGILEFPFSSGCPQRWAALTLGLMASGGLLVDGVPAWAGWGGGDAGALRAMAGLGETMFGAVCAIIWLAAASNIFIAVMSQSAVGTQRISEWPAMNFVGSMAEMLPVGIAIVFTAAPGAILGQLLACPWWLTAALAGGTLLLGFPITLLSQMAGSSTWEVIDLQVLGAAVRCPFSMMLFYFQSACLIAICAAPTTALGFISLYLPLVLAPLYVGGLIVYSRLLGRLAWRLSEKMPVDEATDDGEARTAENAQPLH